MNSLKPYKSPGRRDVIPSCYIVCKAAPRTWGHTRDQRGKNFTPQGRTELMPPLPLFAPQLYPPHLGMGHGPITESQM